MKLALMQPYFFPYMGYFDLINYTDRWVVFDLAQFTRRGWVNRNRILHPLSGWQYISLPISKAPQKTPIRQLLIHNKTDWRNRIINQIDHYRKSAPYFRQVKHMLEQCIEPSYSGVVELTVHALSKVCEYVGVDFKFELISKLNVSMKEIKRPSDWVFQLCELTGADEYVNLSGGTELYEKAVFEKRGLKLVFRDLPIMTYDCPGYVFEPGLSILDVLMWNSPQEVCDFLNSN